MALGSEAFGLEMERFFADRLRETSTFGERCAIWWAGILLWGKSPLEP
ncbi:MAG: hypothetical protein R6T96_11510 [Longimicrobiales bacterium]